MTTPSDLALRERFIRLSSAAIFLIFFQTYMIAPLIPSLTTALHASQQKVGLLVPAYTLPYAFAAILSGALADRLGRRGLYFASLTAFPILGLAMAGAPSLNVLLILRAISGIANVGVVVMSITLIGDLFAPGERARALGWLFGAIAGGGAFGSTLAGILAPHIGWRGLFVLTAVLAIVILPPSVRLWHLLHFDHSKRRRLRDLMRGYASILGQRRAQRTYAYIYLNGIFHSGAFTWLGVHLHNRYGLGETGIGLALLGYGVPGFLLGPLIGRVVDRHGRARLIPAGIALAGISVLLFVPQLPLAIAIFAATLLSLGFDMSHPLLAGIATTLDDNRRGQAMGLNTFSIFFGYGSGSLIFGALTAYGTGTAFLIFASFQLVLAAVAMGLFKGE